MGTVVFVGYWVFMWGLTVGFWVLAYQDLSGPYCDKHLMHSGDTCSRLHVPGARGGYTREQLNHPGAPPVTLTLPSDFHPAPDNVFNGVYRPATMQRIHHGDGLQFLAGGALFTLITGIQSGRAVHRTYRARGEQCTDDPRDRTAWNQVPRGAGRRARNKVVAGALPAEPRYRYGLRSWTIFFGVLAAAAAAFVATSSLIGVTESPFWMEVLTAFAPITVVVAAVKANRKLSRRYRAIMRRRAVTTTGEIIDCTTYSQSRPYSGYNYLVIVTVRFADPEFPEPPRWIRRSYLFTELPTTAAQFATEYRDGTTVTVYRNVRRTWYDLGIDDDHLVWSQWW